MAVERAETLAHAPSVRALVEQGRLSFEPDPKVRELVTLLFAERDYGHLFVMGGRLSPDGRAVADAILGAAREGLDPAPMHSDLLAEKLAAFEASGDTTALLGHLQLTRDDEQALLAFMMNNAALDGTLPAVDAVFDVIATAGATNPVPGFAEAISGLTEQLSRVAEMGPELELILAAGFVRYAVTNRLANFNYITPDEAAAAGWRLSDARQRDEIERSLAGAAFRRGEADGFAAELAALRPGFEQYPRLVEGLARYEGFRAAGAGSRCRSAARSSTAIEETPSRRFVADWRRRGTLSSRSTRRRSTRGSRPRSRHTRRPTR